MINCRYELDGVPDKTERRLNLEGSVFSEFPKTPKAGYRASFLDVTSKVF